MTSTFAAGSSRSSRRPIKAVSKILAAALLLATACASAPKSETTPPVKEAPFFRVPVQASPDSALKLARFALGAVKGAIQPAMIQREVLLVSTQYTRQQRNGRYVQITIIAAVDRKPKEGSTPATMVELSAWAIDLPQEETRLAAPPGSRPGTMPTLTTTTPYTMSSSQHQPYRVTRKEAEDWAALEEVLNSLIDYSTKK